MKGALLFAALTVALYASVLRAPFVYEDDQIMATVAAPVHLNEQAWTRPGRMVPTIVYHLTSLVSDRAPFGYRVVSLAGHLLIGLLVFQLAAALTSAPGAPWIAAAIWLWHPLQTESVSYIAAQPDIWATLATVVACWAALTITRPAVRAVVVLLALAVAVYSKESAVIAPALVALTAYGAGSRIHRYALAAAAIVVVGGVVLQAHAWLVTWEVGASSHGVLGAAAMQATALWRYLALVVVPIGQSVDHDFVLVPPQVHVAALAALVAVVAMAVRLSARWPLLTWAVAWVVVALAPRFLARTPETLTEHHLYLPMVAISIGLGAAIARVCVDSQTARWIGEVTYGTS